MIGNDIVDIQLANIQSNWKRKGWIDKLYTSSEQEYIFNSSDPTESVWKLWSMKEAAYKAHQRRFSFAPKYNPKSFICSDSKVSIDGYKYITKTTIFQDLYIHTSAHISTTDFKTVTYYKDQVAIKKCLQEHIADEYCVKIEDIAILKDSNNIPNLFIKGKRSTIPFSLSAHGNYSGYILRI